MVSEHSEQLEMRRRELNETKRRHARVCEQEQEVKGQQGELQKEHGRLEVEEKARVRFLIFLSLPPLPLLASPPCTLSLHCRITLIAF